MAKVYKCPVCIWESHQKRVTARLVDDYEEGIAVAETRKEALESLREYIVHRAKHDDYFWLEPDFAEGEIRQVKVRIVPEYREGDRRFPCKEPILLKLPCAVGKRASGLWAAFFPTLDVYFDFYEKSRFNELANHYAKQFLSEMTPQELSRFLPPAACDIDTLTVSVKETQTPQQEGVSHPNLSQIADPVGKRSLGRVTRTWEREEEIAALMRMLQEEGTCVCISGEPGSGKTSILAEAARRLERDPGSKGEAAKFWLSSAARIIAGMRYLGEWEQRCEAAIQELANLRGVLCVENLLELVSLGGSGPESSIAAFLIPYLRNTELRLVGECSPSELEACDRLLPGLIDEMQILKIDPLDPKRSLSILSHAGEFLSQNEGVAIPGLAAQEVYQLFRRFQPYVAFPGKAIQLLGSAVDRKLQANDTSALSLNEVRREFGSTTGLPELFLREDLPLVYEDLEQTFSERLLGQREAVKQVCRTVAKFKAGLNDPGRPIGVMLFAGPTGVGKTQMAKFLGDYLFPNKPERDRLIRLDMSEYSGHDAGERLLGNILGRPSELIQKVRANPFSVILLDEIEKAAPEVFDVLMNVFDEGRLSDPLGRTTAFNSTIIIMTSNLGATSSGPIGFAAAGDDGLTPVQVDPSAIRQFFRPEFFNRIDRVIHFQPLDQPTIRTIAALELEAAGKREGFRDRRLELTFSDALVDALARLGFDPALGVRPLQRTIEEHVILPVARYLVQHRPTTTTLHLDWDSETSRLTIEPASE